MLGMWKTLTAALRCCLPAACGGSQESDRKLKGKVVVITDATSKLGEALAHAFYSAGCKLILLSKDEEALSHVEMRLVSSKQGNNRPSSVNTLRVTDSRNFPRIVARMVELFGYSHVDILVNNLGISNQGEAHNTTTTNKTVHLTEALLPRMKVYRNGHIITICSMQSTHPKHPLESFCERLRALVAKYEYDIKVSVVLPRPNNASAAGGPEHGATTDEGYTPQEVVTQVLSAVLSESSQRLIATYTQRIASNYIPPCRPSTSKSLKPKTSRPSQQASITDTPRIASPYVPAYLPPTSTSLNLETNRSTPGLSDMRDLLPELPTIGQPTLKTDSACKQQKYKPESNRDAYYSPERLTGEDSEAIMRNAMFEQRELWRVKEPTLRDTMRGLYDEYQLGTCGLKLTSQQQPLRKLKGNYGVYRIGWGWILKPFNIPEEIYEEYYFGNCWYLINKNTPNKRTEQNKNSKYTPDEDEGKFPYDVAYDGANFVRPLINKNTPNKRTEQNKNSKYTPDEDEGKFPYDVAYDGANFVRPSYDKHSSMPTIDPFTRQTLLVCDDTKLLNDSHLYSSVENVNVMSAALPSFNLVQGVPGCGKTTYILENVQPSDIVLFATREGAEDFSKRFKKTYPKSGMTSENLRRYFRTIDSYLISQSFFTPHANKVIVDEALLAHLGSLLFAAVKARASEVQLVGDAHQIPYINRQHDCESLFSSPVTVATVSKILSVTYRCTNTTAAILSPYYSQGVHAVSSVQGEMSLKAFTSVNDIPFNDSVKVLVFKQSEKKELKACGYDVSTIHEYQGKQAPHIVVVRTSGWNKEKIYNSLPHCVVAISRHTETFTYYSPVRTDQLAKWILKSKKLTARQYIRSMQIAPIFMGEAEPST